MWGGGKIEFPHHLVMIGARLLDLHPLTMMSRPASSDYDEPDGSHWRIGGRFTSWITRSVGIVNYRFMWKLDISLKIEILWMMLRNCILNKDKPLKRRWTGNYQCHFSVAAKKLLISCCLVAL